MKEVTHEDIPPRDRVLGARKALQVNSVWSKANYLVSVVYVRFICKVEIIIASIS